MSVAKPASVSARARTARSRSNSSSLIPTKIRAAYFRWPNWASLPISSPAARVITDRWHRQGGAGSLRIIAASGAGLFPYRRLARRSRSYPVDSAIRWLEIAIIEITALEPHAMEEAQGYHALANEFTPAMRYLPISSVKAHHFQHDAADELPAEVQPISHRRVCPRHARALIVCPEKNFSLAAPNASVAKAQFAPKPSAGAISNACLAQPQEGTRGRGERRR